MTRSLRSPHRHRVFFALEFEPDFCLALAQWRRQFFLPEAKPVATADLHLTLSFVGEVDPGQLESLMAMPAPKLAPFPLRFGELGVFARSNIVFVAAINPPNELTQLAAYCEKHKRNLRLGAAEKTFVPHVTLARECLSPVTAATQALLYEMTIRHFVLMESVNGRDGSRYHVIQSWPLYRPLRPAVPRT